MSAAATLAIPAGRRPALQIAGSAILLLLLVLVLPRHKLLDALRSIPPHTLAAVVPLYLAIHFLGCLKWHWMVNGAGAGMPFPQSVRCYYAGMFSNLFLPSVIGGDVVTIALGVTQSRKTEAVVSGTLASRLFDLASLVLIASVAVVVFPHRLDAMGERLILLVLAVFLVAGALAVLAVFLLRRKLGERIAAYWRAFAAAWRRPRLTLLIFGMSVFAQTGLIALTAWVSAASGLNLPARAWLFAWPLAKLSAFVPVTLAGIGTRELVLVALLAPFGAEPASAAGVALAWDAVFICGSLAGGVISKGASRFAPAPSAPNRPCVP